MYGRRLDFFTSLTLVGACLRPDRMFLVNKNLSSTIKFSPFIRNCNPNLNNIADKRKLLKSYLYKLFIHGEIANPLRNHFLCD